MRIAAPRLVSAQSTTLLRYGRAVGINADHFCGLAIASDKYASPAAQRPEVSPAHLILSYSHHSASLLSTDDRPPVNMSAENFPTHYFVRNVTRLLDTIKHKDVNYTPEERIQNLRYVIRKVMAASRPPRYLRAGGGLESPTFLCSITPADPHNSLLQDMHTEERRHTSISRMSVTHYLSKRRNSKLPYGLSRAWLSTAGSMPLRTSWPPLRSTTHIL